MIGQAMITYELTDWRDGLLWWLQSVYVLPEHRRRGVFRALYEHIRSLARADGDVRGALIGGLGAGVSATDHNDIKSVCVFHRASVNGQFGTAHCTEIQAINQLVPLSGNGITGK